MATPSPATPAFNDTHDPVDSLVQGSHAVPELAPPAPTDHTQPRYAPIPSNPSQSSNLLQITFEQTFIMTWKNLQVRPHSPYPDTLLILLSKNVWMAEPH
jgi:hypothetical protein